MKTPKKSRSSSALHESFPNRARRSSTQSCYACGSRTNSVEPANKNKQRPPWRSSFSRQSSDLNQFSTSSIHGRPAPTVISRRGSVAIKSFEEMKSSSSNFVSTMKNRKNAIRRIKAVVSSRGNNADEVLVEAISLSDKSVFVHLLRQLPSKPVTLKLAARILPEIRSLLSHRNSSFVNTALETLDNIVTRLNDSIRNGLSLNAQSLEDDATKQRHLLSTKCKESLLEIYINLAFITSKLDEEQNLYFQSILDKFIDLVV